MSINEKKYLCTTILHKFEKQYISYITVQLFVPKNVLNCMDYKTKVLAWIEWTDFVVCVSNLVYMHIISFCWYISEKKYVGWKLKSVSECHRLNGSCANSCMAHVVSQRFASRKKQREVCFRPVILFPLLWTAEKKH